VKPTAFLGFTLLSAAVLLSGCRGQTSRKPPIFIQHGMEFQPRFNAFEGNAFYADGRNMRTPPAGTVARGLLKDEDAYYRGGDSAAPLHTSPVPMTAELLERGQGRYNIYCAPCHARTGLGNGMVVQRGFLPPPSLNDPRIVSLGDGQIFQVISKGKGNMPSYAKQVPEADRWAIVAYVRALQYSQNAGEAK
jgi:mono/diheme cytochrome c family protein